jgi:hypothetical protein
MSDDQGKYSGRPTSMYGPALLVQWRPPRDVDPGLPRPCIDSSLVTLRRHADALHVRRRLASARGIGYQVLLERFGPERPREEERRQENR